MAGSIAPADIRISTARMRQILKYEPRDLTISVQPGMPLAELNAELATHGQMIPLEGPYGEKATIGGVAGANISGARRRLYGTARDLVIGMTFATLDGKLVETGGMVVKNVAGLDMGKVLIGSFGTLAAIASINFKLLPRAERSITLLLTFADAQSASGARDALVRGPLNPAAVDILNPVLSAQIGLRNFNLAIVFEGIEAVVARSLREAEGLGRGRVLATEEAERFWNSVYSVTPRFLEKFRDGAAVRVSTTLSDCIEALETLEGAGHAHAASGIVRGWFRHPDTASKWLASALRRGWKGVIEFSAESARQGLTLWPEPGSDFAIMKEVKRMFDPENLLNRGRLYDRI